MYDIWPYTIKVWSMADSPALFFFALESSIGRIVSQYQSVSHCDIFIHFHTFSLCWFCWFLFWGQGRAMATAKHRDQLWSRDARSAGGGGSGKATKATVEQPLRRTSRDRCLWHYIFQNNLNKIMFHTLFIIVQTIHSWSILILMLDSPGKMSGSLHVEPVDPEQVEEKLRAKRLAARARRDERVGRWARALVEWHGVVASGSSGCPEDFLWQSTCKIF